MTDETPERVETHEVREPAPDPERVKETTTVREPAPVDDDNDGDTEDE